MTSPLDDYNIDLQQQIRLLAETEGAERSLPDTFTETVLEQLSEAGEVDDPEVAAYQARGARVSAFEVSEDGATLTVVLSDYHSTAELVTLGKAEVDTHFKRLRGFVDAAKTGLWRKLEESDPAWDMCQRIEFAWESVGQVRMVLLTNALVRAAVQPLRESDELDGRSTHIAIWDLDRLHKLHTSGRVQEPISIDVRRSWGDPIHCLGPEGDGDSYEAYLMLLPGGFLAEIYDIHGPRLLELNVRSFLQSRGKVNRGIQETIKNEPGRFLAYNNGISMTASRVVVGRNSDGAQVLRQVDDLQIVNGGQTTASLHHAAVKNKADLSGIFVQAKLSVVKPEQLSELVPRISEFANSQNKVNMADFTANDPFHVELEKLSRSIWAPGVSGSQQMTRWFYERARGQYADAHARERTPAKQREFKKVHPVSQKFTKTDVAKYENTWDQMPWLVSLGAEKNFREFMLELRRRGSNFKPDQQYFERLIAKAILFRRAERIIGRLQLGGYRSQTVTYTLAKISHLTAQRIDLDLIWRTQELSENLASEIEGLSRLIHQTLIRSAGTQNVSEWAKKEGCWKAILDFDYDLTSDLRSELVKGGSRTSRTSTMSIGEMLTDEESAAASSISQVSADTWFALSAWAKATSNLAPWQRSIAFSLGKNVKNGKDHSRKQALQGARIWEEASRKGFRGDE